MSDFTGATATATVDAIMSRLKAVAPESRPIVFSAPNNIGLVREGKPNHKPEEWTTFLALDRSKAHYHKNNGAVDPSNQDPNHAKEVDLDDNKWYVLLRSLQTRCIELAPDEGRETRVGI